MITYLHVYLLIKGKHVSLQQWQNSLEAELDLSRHRHLNLLLNNNFPNAKSLIHVHVT